MVEPVEGGGFGWDTIFVPDGETEPFSSMTTERKCELSHRSLAVNQWADWLGSNIDELYERQYGRPAIGHKGLESPHLYCFIRGCELYIFSPSSLLSYFL